MTRVDLIQPRHTYAPAQGPGHIYLPSSLLTAGARLLDAGLEVRIHDLNIGPATLSSNIIGINLVGAPYIQDVIELQERTRRDIGLHTRFLVGGQVISGLQPEQFRRLFREDSINGNDDANLTEFLGIRELTPPEKTSLIPAYEVLPDEQMKKYLSREITFYVSQGCKFSCDFCSAVRTTRDPLTGEIKVVKETYRDPEVVERDLIYLSQRAKRLGIEKLKIYMSNLDVFQKPRELQVFAESVKRVRGEAGIDIRLRGLSTAASFVSAKKKHSEAIESLVEAGLHTIGFGVDGATPEVWKAIGKQINTQDNCLEAIRSARAYGITPETIMVFGHAGVDTPKSLQLSYDFTQYTINEFDAVPRPQVAKSFVPGNDGWKSPTHSDAVETIMQDPKLFQVLDFNALPSQLTHPDAELRAITTEHYLRMAELPRNTTLVIKPVTPGMTRDELEEVRRFNEGKFDR